MNPAFPDAQPWDMIMFIYWSIKDKPAWVIQLQLLSIPVVVIIGAAFSTLAIHLGKLPDTLISGLITINSGSISINLASGLIEIGLFLVGFAATIVLRSFGAPPHYGLLWEQFMFYATSPGFGFRRNAYLLTMMAPLVGLRSLAVLGMLMLQGYQLGRTSANARHH